MINRIEADIRGWDTIAGHSADHRTDHRTNHRTNHSTGHRTGTGGDNRTAEWLADTLRSAGAEPHLETFPFQRRVLHECSVSIGDQKAEGIPLFDGGYTDEQGITAPLTPLADTLAAPTAADSNTGTGTHIGVTSFTSIGKHPSTRQMHAARAKNYPALVAYAAAQHVEPGLALLNAPHYTHPYGPPVLQVSTEHGDWLEAAAVEKAVAKLTAHVTLEQTTASNVQTTIQGRDPSLAPLVIMTPCSAWWTCTAERGGGIALWLECVRHFAQTPGDRTVIFTANTGHELGHIGLDYFLEERPHLLRGAHAWIHLGANFATVDSNVLYQASPDLMQLGLDALAAESTSPDAITPASTRPLGEAENIYDGGGRYLSLLGTNRWFHHPDDRWPHTVDLERTVQLNQAMLQITTQLARK